MSVRAWAFGTRNEQLLPPAIELMNRVDQGNEILDWSACLDIVNGIEHKASAG